MVRSPASRFVACLIVLAIGFAVPGSALAHGVAHHRAGHEHDPHAALSDAHTQGAAVSPSHDADDHAHPRIDQVVSARLEFLLLTVPVPRHSVAIEYVLVSNHGLIVPAARPRAAPAHAPPLQPRAPPLG